MRETIEFNFDKVIFNETDGAGKNPNFRILYKTEDKQITVLRENDPAEDFIVLRTTQFELCSRKRDLYLRIDPVLSPLIYYRYNDSAKLLEITDSDICSFFKRFLTDRGYL